MINPRWTTLRPHPTQQAYAASLFDPTARFIALVCGRRSGKTELSMRRLVQAAILQDRKHGLVHEYRFAAPTVGQARDLVWGHLKQLADGFVTHISEAPRYEIETYNPDLGIRSRIKVIGLDAAQRAEGMGYDGVVIDESSDIKPGVYALSIRPALADRRGWCVRMGIPKRVGVGATEYRAFCELAFSGKAANTRGYSWTSESILPQEEIDALKYENSADDYREQYLAEWVGLQAGAFRFEPDVHIRPCAYDPTRPIWVACDFNVTPMAWCLNHSDGRALTTFDEIWLSNTHTQATLDILHDRYGDHKGGWFFYGDATGNSRSTNAPASNYAIIQNDKRFRPTLRIPAANPNRVDRLASCNALLRNGAGEVRWHIDPRCVHLIKDLRQRVLDEDGGPKEGKAGEEIGHSSDAAGYLIHYTWPSTRLVSGAAKAYVGS